ncbi:Glyoxylase, beta-lactamase superfamily II [Thalassobacillus cyri]|uniref:Glyoxylase, beta-lactamase superfamily II n=1 Tax=Thalassobacillus cyri TaxID=571932 RepID=A0A1H4EKQ7_9BACI|nr:MBL fold metallo-hydrolase [Thalassobacillus cyri]SEA85447.1 Glyoxylase, beta-lactamase superfamily II [Thalassobacillus cyri]
MKNVKEVKSGIYRISLPQPVSGDVFVYLIKNDKVTLIDAGHPSSDSQACLVDALKELGVGWGDIDQLIVTHRDMDHIGALLSHADELDCKVFAGYPSKKEPKLYEQLEGIRPQLPDQFTEELLTKVTMDEIDFAHAEHLPITDLVKQGDVIDIGGGRVEVLETPGHSYDHISLYEPDSKLLFGGDVLIENGPPTKIIDLQQYLLTLDALKQKDVTEVFPSHGPVMYHHHDAIEQSITTIIDIDQKIITCLKDGSKSCYDLALQFNNGKVDEHLLFYIQLISNHLNRLKDKDIIIETDKGVSLQ